MFPLLISALTWLEQKPVADTAFRDTLGNSLPKLALTRSNTERVDVAISNFGNTLCFGLGGVLIDQVLKAWFSNEQKQKIIEGGKKVAVDLTKERWAVASRSLGIYSAMASTMWAMPFIRNYITTKRSGSVSYSDVIQSGGRKGPATPEQKAALAASLNDSKTKALTILGVGAAGILAPAILGKLAASKGKDFGAKALNWIANNKFTKPFMLEGGQFTKLAGVPSMLFWGIPAYVGWYHASRDPYEKQEVAIRAANFLVCFFAPMPLMNKIFKGKFEEKFKDLKNDVSFANIAKVYEKNRPQLNAAQKLLVTKNAISMVSSIVLLGVTPQILNIFLTKRRLEKDARQKALLSAQTQSLNAQSTPTQPVQAWASPQMASALPFGPQPSIMIGRAPADFPTASNAPAPQSFPPIQRYVASPSPVRLGGRAAFG
jgi:hypothetical protein